MDIYPLKTILDTFTKSDISKRAIYNQAPIGGISNKIIVLIIMLLPLFEHAAIFNPYSFKALGIATAIVFFIVGLSLIMIITFFLVHNVKKNTIKKITPSWNHYFKDIDLNTVLSSGITPYSDFFKYYKESYTENCSDKELHTKLLNAFVKMQEENSDLIDAINGDTKEA